MFLPFAFPDQERYEKPTVISYPMQPDGSGHNIPGLTSKGMLISWKSTGNLKYNISIVCLYRRLFELLYLGPILAYELRRGTLNLSHFICYTWVGFFQLLWSSTRPVVLVPSNSVELEAHLQRVLRCHWRYSCPKSGRGTRRNLWQLLFELCCNTRFVSLFQWGSGSNSIWKGWKTVSLHKP